MGLLDKHETLFVFTMAALLLALTDQSYDTWSDLRFVRPSEALLMQGLKLCFSVSMCLLFGIEQDTADLASEGPWFIRSKAICEAMKQDMLKSWRYYAELLIPAAHYTFASSICQLLPTNTLDMLTFTVFYQSKPLAVALLAAIILRPKLSVLVWISVLALSIGTADVLVSDHLAPTTVISNAFGGYTLVGLFLLGNKIVMLSFTEVHLEYLLKHYLIEPFHTENNPKKLVWRLNCFFSLWTFTGALFIAYFDPADVASPCFSLVNYTWLDWTNIVLRAIVSVLAIPVLASTSALTKTFACSWAFVSAKLISTGFTDWNPSLNFLCGTALVLLATYVYGGPTAEKNQGPPFSSVSMGEELSKEESESMNNWTEKPLSSVMDSSQVQ